MYKRKLTIVTIKFWGKSIKKEKKIALQVLKIFRANDGSFHSHLSSCYCCKNYFYNYHISFYPVKYVEVKR